jgi:hypothetical protein
MRFAISFPACRKNHSSVMQLKVSWSSIRSEHLQTLRAAAIVFQNDGKQLWLQNILSVEHHKKSETPRMESLHLCLQSAYTNFWCKSKPKLRANTNWKPQHKTQRERERDIQDGFIVLRTSFRIPKPPFQQTPPYILVSLNLLLKWWFSFLANGCCEIGPASLERISFIDGSRNQ